MRSQGAPIRRRHRLAVTASPSPVGKWPVWPDFPFSERCWNLDFIWNLPTFMGTDSNISRKTWCSLKIGIYTVRQELLSPTFHVSCWRKFSKTAPNTRLILPLWLVSFQEGTGLAHLVSILQGASLICGKSSKRGWGGVRLLKDLLLFSH